MRIQSFLTIMNFLKRQLIEENTTVGQVNYKIWLSASIDSFIRWSGWCKSAKNLCELGAFVVLCKWSQRNFEVLLFLRIAGKTSPGVQNLHKFNHFWLANGQWPCSFQTKYQEKKEHTCLKKRVSRKGQAFVHLWFLAANNLPCAFVWLR